MSRPSRGVSRLSSCSIERALHSRPIRRAEDDIFPVSVIVAIADAAEDPAAVQLVREVFGVQYAVDSGVVLVDLGVLRMEVEDRMFLAEGADCGDGVNTLPDQMAGVEVGADFRADSGAELGAVSTL